MRIAFGLIIAFLLISCAPVNVPVNTSGNITGDITGNATSNAAGNAAIDFCNEDAQCVRQPQCCDCGVGKWVNEKYQLPSPPQCEQVCRCALQRSIGVCRDHRCVGELV